MFKKEIDLEKENLPNNIDKKKKNCERSFDQEEALAEAEFTQKIFIDKAISKIENNFKLDN